MKNIESYHGIENVWDGGKNRCSEYENKDKEILSDLKHLAEFMDFKRKSMPIEEWVEYKNDKAVNSIWDETVRKCSKCKHVRDNNMCQKRYDGYKCENKSLYENKNSPLN
jgi:hypothetical protein